MKDMNTVQKISLIVAGVSFTYWIFAAYDKGFELFDPDWWDDGFDYWYLQLSFAIFVGSIISFNVFKHNNIEDKKSDSSSLDDEEETK